MAGNGARAVQQSVCAVLFDWGEGAQQLCAVLCVRGRQVASGASRQTINGMATAARWIAPRNMVSAYHGGPFLR